MGARVLIIFTLFGLLQTTTTAEGFHNHSLTSKKSLKRSYPEVLSADNYDPVEAYHQLRRYYLTSTSRIDRDNHNHRESFSHPTQQHRTRNQHYSHHLEAQRAHHHHQQRQEYHHRNHQHHSYGYVKNAMVHYGRNQGQEQRRNEATRTGSFGTLTTSPHHRCYVCLPPNTASREASDILAMFPRKDRQKIPQCSDFNEKNASSFEFNCPRAFGGCILRIHGANISRACSKYRLNDCKKATSVEFCYCTQPLCNSVKPQPVRLNSRPDDDEDGDDGLGSGDLDEDKISLESEKSPRDVELETRDVTQGLTTTVVDTAALANVNIGDPNDVDVDVDATAVTSRSVSNSRHPLAISTQTFVILILGSLLWWHFPYDRTR